VAALLPGIGWGKSAAVENKFKTVLDMVAADQRDWETIPGIGPTIAKRAVDSLRLRKGETE
jgi:NAD-dependent DNA ligase